METLGYLLSRANHPHRVSCVRTIGIVHAHRADDSGVHVHCCCKDWPRGYSAENVPMTGTQRKRSFPPSLGRSNIDRRIPMSPVGRMAPFGWPLTTVNEYGAPKSTPISQPIPDLSLELIQMVAAFSQLTGHKSGDGVPPTKAFCNNQPKTNRRVTF